MNPPKTKHSPISVTRRSVIAASLIVAVAALLWVFQRGTLIKPEPGTRDFAVRVPVNVAAPEMGVVRDSVAVVGLVDAWRDVDILSETSGIVRSVSSEVGERKSAGQTLLKVDDEVAASALRKAKINQALARRDFERYSNLQREGAVAVSSCEAMKLKLEDAEADLVAAQRRYSDTAVKAPIAGTVTARTVEVGELVQPGMKVANMVDLSRIRIKSSVPEKQVAMISAGMTVRVTTDVWPGQVFQATVSSVSAKSSRDHTYLVESVMDNPHGTPFKAGMFARTVFLGSKARNSLLIPRQALVGSVRNPEVFVIAGGVAHRVRIVAGAESGRRLEVLKGLDTGDLVVVSGQNELEEGSPVTVSRQEAGR